MALAPSPKLLIMDEPTNGLDPSGIRWLNSLVTEFAMQGGAVLLSSHQLAQLEHLAHRVLVIDDGKLICDQPMKQFTSTGGESRFRIRCSAVDILQAELVKLGIQASASVKGELLVRGCEADYLAIAVHRFGGVISLFTQDQSSLEDSFHKFVDEHRKY